MPLSQDSKDTILGTLSSEFGDGSKNVYFQYFSTLKDLGEETIHTVLARDLEDVKLNIARENSQGFCAWHDEEPIYFIEIPGDRWLIIYSSSVAEKLRKNISKADNYHGWIANSWIPSEILSSIYEEFCPQDKSVKIERRWDPYWIYQRGSDVPDEMQDYYSDNIDKFVEREIEFNLKTPKGLVNDALQAGVTDRLLDKSELSETQFEMRIPASSRLLSDGGALAADSISESDRHSSRVEVELDGEVTHSSGDPRATLYLLDEIEERNVVYDEFDEITGERSLEEHDNGIHRVADYSPPKTLRVEFVKKEFNKEASIKLSNLLTVGQDDVDLHGIVKHRDGKKFLAETYTVFDNGEADILFTEYNGNSTVYIRPISTSTAGLVYIYWKLTQKFDPRVDREIVTENLGDWW